MAKERSASGRWQSRLEREAADWRRLAEEHPGDTRAPMSSRIGSAVSRRSASSV